MAGRLTAFLCFLALLVQAQTAPRLLYRVEPVYPPLAMAMRIQGEVRLLVAVDADGTVAGLRLISGHPLLVNAAMEAVKQWRYRSGRRAIFPVGINFTISHGPPEQATRV